MASGEILKPPVTMTKLWTNPSPSSNFGAQTIPLDLSNYDMVRVMWRRGTNASGDGQAMDCAIPSSQNMMMTMWFGAYAVPFSYRECAPSSTGVYFGNCTQKTAASTSGASNHNQDCIPTAIYGIKGIT